MALISLSCIMHRFTASRYLWHNYTVQSRCSHLAPYRPRPSIPSRPQKNVTDVNIRGK